MERNISPKMKAKSTTSRLFVVWSFFMQENISVTSQKKHSFLKKKCIHKEASVKPIQCHSSHLSSYREEFVFKEKKTASFQINIGILGLPKTWITTVFSPHLPQLFGRKLQFPFFLWKVKFLFQCELLLWGEYLSRSHLLHLCLWHSGWGETWRSL